jgi:hypothetical protein
MKKRSIGMMILLTFVTLGFYLLIWSVMFQSELKEKTDEGFGGLGHLLATLFTFGIYYIIWQYLAGKRLAKQGATDNSVLYLILAFVFPVANPFLMQDQANKL